MKSPKDSPGGGTAAHTQQDHNRETRWAQSFHQNDQKAVWFCERVRSFRLSHSSEIRAVLCKQMENYDSGGSGDSQADKIFTIQGSKEQSFCLKLK